MPGQSARSGFKRRTEPKPLRREETLRRSRRFFFADFVGAWLERAVYQPFYRPAPYQMFLEDSIRVFDADMTVPDIFGVNHDHGAVPALIHASGVIDADGCFQAGVFYQLFEPGMYTQGIALYGTRAAAGADKHMFLKWSHFRDSRRKIIAGKPGCVPPGNR